MSDSLVEQEVRRLRYAESQLKALVANKPWIIECSGLRRWGCSMAKRLVEVSVSGAIIGLLEDPDYSAFHLLFSGSLWDITAGNTTSEKEDEILKIAGDWLEQIHVFHDRPGFKVAAVLTDRTDPDLLPSDS